MDFTKIDITTFLVKGVYDSAIDYINNSEQYCIYNPIITKDGFIAPTLKNVLVTPMLPSCDNRTLQDLAIDSISLYYAGSNFPPAWLYVNFLLKTSICYVEVIDMADKVQKFLMCSNLNILSYYGSVSRFSEADVAIGGSEIRGIKINKTKLTRPRTPIDIEKVKGIRVVPLELLQTLAKRICSDLKTKMMSFKYEKDNGQIREMCSTLSSTKLHNYYGFEKVTEILAMTGETLSKGFLRVPELGASKYDSAVRSLNITKITEIAEVNEIDTSFINVDFDLIIPSFKNTVKKWSSNLDILKALADDLGIKYSNEVTSYMLSSTLENWVDLRRAMGSTMFLRTLHKYMLSRPILFEGYTGERTSLASNYSFNLGVGDSADEDSHDGGVFVFQ